MSRTRFSASAKEMARFSAVMLLPSPCSEEVTSTILQPSRSARANMVFVRRVLYASRTKKSLFGERM